MIDFVPLESYTPLFYHFLLVIVFFTWLESKYRNLTGESNLVQKNVLGIVLLIVIIPYMGLRPISGTYFGDTSTYASLFNEYANGIASNVTIKDFGFITFSKICASIMDVHMYFLFCAFLFIYPLALASKKIFGAYWFYAFLMLLCSFSFWGAGVNGVRSGIATSFLILAFAYREKKIMMGVLLFLAFSFHNSMLLPIIAFFSTLFYNDSKKLLYFWLLCIPLSLAAGGFFETIFDVLGFNDRAAGYLTDEADDQFSRIGFRWDFLLYSATAVYAGWYFIFHKKFEDKFYRQLFNTYLIANGFWILVIRASFSNRFAYLSWFIMGVIIVYPFLKMQFFNKQNKVLGNVIFLYFAFTYILTVILAK